MLAQPILEVQELVYDGCPVHREAEVTILFGLDLLVHESAGIFKCVELVPGFDKPARYFTTFVAVVLEDSGEGARDLWVVCLHLVVRMELRTCLIVASVGGSSAL